MHLLAREYHSRPSSILSIDDEWAAYQFDLACLELAAYVEAELRKNRSLQSILGGRDGPTARAREFADARQLGPIRSMRIPESGVW